MASSLFCPICGGNTLARLSVKVGADGVVEYGYNPNRKINLRGTIYSIPKVCLRFPLFQHPLIPTLLYSVPSTSILFSSAA